MRTVVVSDLHLATASDTDLVRRARFRDLLLAGIEGADRIVLLGDVIELRDRPLGEALEIAAPFFAALAEASGGAEIVYVPGNHDHHLIEHRLEQRALDGAGPLGLEERSAPEGLLAAVGARSGLASLTVAYPGLWLRDDVYATHGHFLDRHLTVPTFERLGVAAVERILGIPAGGPDPLAPPDEPITRDAEEYERIQAPVYAFLTALAQAGVGGRRGGGSPSARVWAMVGGGGETRAAKVRGWLLGSVAVPGAVGVANRLGLGPVRPDLSSGAIARAGIAAMVEVVERLAIDAEHVVFGHTHRRGPIGDEPGWEANGTLLWNTGSWVYMPGLIGESSRQSHYWPGTIAVLEDSGPPELRHLLDELAREELAIGGDDAPAPGLAGP